MKKYYLREYEIHVKSYQNEIIQSHRKTANEIIQNGKCTEFDYPEIQWLKNHNCQFDISWSHHPSKYFNDYKRCRLFIDIEFLSDDNRNLFLQEFKGLRQSRKKFFDELSA